MRFHPHIPPPTHNTVKTLDTIPETPVNFTAAAKHVSDFEGQSLSRQGLTKWVRDKNILTTTVGKREHVNPRLVAQSRQDFTREVMRGEHLTDTPAAAPVPEQPTSLDVARDAKARKEMAQAEAAELALAREKNNLVDVHDATAAAAAAMASVKTYLIGPAVGYLADTIIAALKLPDTAKRDLEPLIAREMRAALAKMPTQLAEDFARMNTFIAPDLPSRLDLLMTHAADLHALSADDLSNVLADSA